MLTAPDRTLARQPRAVATVAIEVAAGARLGELQAEWRDLVARADVSNVFMHPSLAALGACDPNTRVVTLLAWREHEGRRHLAGTWTFGIRQAPRSIIPISTLTAPAFAHVFLGSPVIDRDMLEATLTAMLDHIADDPRLPNILALDDMRADSATMQALERVLAARGSEPCIMRRSSRPMLASRLDAKSYFETALSASSRKKLRQHRRRLAEQGAIESIKITEFGALGRAVEDFLTLEAAGWKGRKHTALLCNPADANFARQLVSTLAPQGDAWIHAITLDHRPISMQIMLRAGSAVFTWKTAYDEALRDFSPGMLLWEDYTAAFLADPSIAVVDSCAYDESSFMAGWSERESMIDLWLDARRNGSVAFVYLSRLQETCLRLRARAKSLYLAHIRRRG